MLAKPTHSPKMSQKGSTKTMSGHLKPLENRDLSTKIDWGIMALLGVKGTMPKQTGSFDLNSCSEDLESWPFWGGQGHRSVDLDFVPNRHKNIKKC